MSKEKDGCKIGIVGTGFIATGLYNLLLNSKRWKVEQVLTRRRLNHVDGFEARVLTNSLEKLIARSDIIVECSGDVIHATNVVSESLKNNRPVVTMDAEFQVTCGHLVSKGYLTEAEGDQPGCLAALREEVMQMDFTPVVYANIKGFTNLNPTPEEMNYWSAKNGVRLEQTVAFTDTTKIEIEQALVANGLGAKILPLGMLGLACDELKEGGIKLAEKALDSGNQSISDYLLSPKLPPGVFIVATSDNIHSSALKYFKMGAGPFYIFPKQYHLCYLEIPKTLERVFLGLPPLLTNGTNPAINVSAIAKRNIEAGHTIKRGIGSFDVRGKAVNRLDDVPIGLLKNAKVVREIEMGQVISWNDVELPESLAVNLWQEKIFPKIS